LGEILGRLSETGNHMKQRNTVNKRELFAEYIKTCYGGIDT